MTSPNPLVAREVSSTTWYTGLGLVEDAAQISSGIENNSWVDGTLGTVGGALDIVGMAIDPLGSLVAWGVSWLMEHVKPLKEALDWLAGNPDAINAHAQTWGNVSKFTGEAHQGYADAIRFETQTWVGESGDAYREHAQIQLTAMDGIAKAAHGISVAVMGAGLLVGLVRGIVRDLIAQFIATLAARLPQWLAEAGLTLGIGTPVVVGQVVALVAKWVNKIQGFIRALLNSLRRLKPMIGKLGDILTELKQILNKLGRSNPLKHGDEPRLPGRSPWREGDPTPPRLTRDEPLPSTPMDNYFHYEDLPGDTRNPWGGFSYPNGEPSAVRYLDEAEREQHRLFVDADGNLRRASDNELFDTSSANTVWGGEDGGRAIFVMDRDGNLYASNYQARGDFHHSSLLAGGEVAGAGEIRVDNGRIIDMTDKSGHYQPSADLNDNAVDELRRQGLNTEGMKQYDFDGNER
jgi:hypothetical protein